MIRVYSIQGFDALLLLCLLRLPLTSGYLEADIPLHLNSRNVSRPCLLAMVTAREKVLLPLGGRVERLENDSTWRHVNSQVITEILGGHLGILGAPCRLHVTLQDP